MSSWMRSLRRAVELFAGQRAAGVVLRRKRDGNGRVPGSGVVERDSACCLEAPKCLFMSKKDWAAHLTLARRR